MGDSELITCDTDIPKWYFNKGELPFNTKIYKHKTLILRNVLLVNSGEYMCEGKTSEENIYTRRKARFAAKSIVVVESK